MNMANFSMIRSWVKTDMGNAGAKMAGFDSAEITMEESCPAMAKLVRLSCLFVVFVFWPFD